MVVYYSDFYQKQTEHHINYPTATAALSEAAYRTKCFWVHRVEVWKDDFRLLLAVH